MLPREFCTNYLFPVGGHLQRIYSAVSNYAGLLHVFKDIGHLKEDLVSKAIVCSFYIFYSTFGLNLYCIQSKQCRLLGWRIKILNKTQKHWKYFIIIFLRLINEQVRAVFIHNLMSKPWFKKKEFLNFSFTFLSDLISSGYHVRLKKVSFSYNLKML